MHPAAESPDSLKRRTNARTALTLLSVAVVFFGGVIAAQYSGRASVGVGVVGVAIIAFLAAAIGRGSRR
jgi:hypothetical protein